MEKPKVSIEATSEGLRWKVVSDGQTVGTGTAQTYDDAQAAADEIVARRRHATFADLLQPDCSPLRLHCVRGHSDTFAEPFTHFLQMELDTRDTNGQACDIWSIRPTRKVASLDGNKGYRNEQASDWSFRIGSRDLGGHLRRRIDGGRRDQSNWN